MKEFWDERYGGTEYVYGVEPNVFFKESLASLSPGSMLLPAEGEGRNAVFAASIGWKVSAFDQSEQAKRKSDLLAKKRGVQLDYRVGTLEDLAFASESFDAIGLIYAHFPPALKESYHRVFHSLLRPGGMILFEAFSKGNLEYLLKNPNIGGPKDEDTLFSRDELRDFFSGYELFLLEEKEVVLEEGIFHNGKGLVIRMIAKKPTRGSRRDI
ncbi:hypothetical protein ADIS_0965 [Lunatimonas lonarensis]|uniref:Methyltransferase domain-containing protein n=1 Tax=Lunatimonas lonarensis TaxID=1232681 RepID=R7ZWU2_9BACT|nr:class I SAM-dependent methyltransferase [Lunatimonas lonarensis]EON78615.1 hypothetical protein ADIS_0965 [Lunatimonas lonarensis]